MMEDELLADEGQEVESFIPYSQAVPLEDKILALLEQFAGHKKTQRSIIVRLHFPTMRNSEIEFVAESSVSTLHKSFRSLRDTGWTSGTTEDLKNLKDLFPLLPVELSRVRALQNGGVPTTTAKPVKEKESWIDDVEIPRFPLPVGANGLPNQFLGYGKWVVSRKKSDRALRVRKEVVARLLELWPEYERTRQRIGGVIMHCLSYMHHEELERFCEYYMDPQKTAQYVYNWHAHEGNKPFDPLMIFPNLDPSVADMVSLSAEHKRDWALYEVLNTLSPTEQRRWINPPTEYKE